MRGLLNQLHLPKTVGYEFYTNQISTAQNQVRVDHLALFGITSSQAKQISNHKSVIWMDKIHQNKPVDADAFHVILLGNSVEHAHFKKSFTEFLTPTNGGDEILTIGDTGLDMRHCMFQGTLRANWYTYNTENGHSIVQKISRLPRDGKLFGYVSMSIPWGHIDLHSDFKDRPNGHGTHVTGIAAGGYTSNCEGIAKRDFPSETKILFFDFLDKDRYSQQPHGGLIIPPVLTPLMELSYASGSRVFSNSWGSETPFYTSYAAEMDRFIYNFDDYNILVANGNSGVGDIPYSVGSPATAKNVISIGASMNTYSAFKNMSAMYFPNRKNFMDMAHIRHNPHLYTHDNLAGFSSRGPTSDGRIKPDIVCPGEFILSTRAQGWTNSDMLYMRGTSMATPLCARGVIIVKERLRKVYGIATPSAALIKNILITSAKMLTGSVQNLYINRNSGKATAHPSEHRIGIYDQGFGRMNLHPFLNKRLGWIDRIPIQQYSKPNIFCFLATETGEMSIGMVYSDPPGTPRSGRVLVNKIVVQVQIFDSEKDAIDNKLPFYVSYGNDNYFEGDLVNNVKRVRTRIYKGNYIRVSIKAVGGITQLRKHSLLEQRKTKLVHKDAQQPVSLVYTKIITPVRKCVHSCNPLDPSYDMTGTTWNPCNPTHNSYGNGAVENCLQCRCQRHELGCGPGKIRMCNFKTGILGDCVSLKKDTTQSLNELYHGRRMQEKTKHVTPFWVVFVGVIVGILVIRLLFFIFEEEKRNSTSDSFRRAYHRAPGKFI